MGSSGTPHQTRLMEGRVDVREPRRTEPEEIVRERALVELVTSRRDCATVDQEPGDRAGRRPDHGKGAPGAGIDIGGQDPLELWRERVHGLGERRFEERRIEVGCDRHRAAAQPFGHQPLERRRELRGDLGESRLVVGESRLGGHKRNTTVTRVTLVLTDADQAKLAGHEGEAQALAMRIVTGLAETMGASALLSIEGAHIDSCLYHGRSGIDFAERLVDGGARVAVPTTLNVSSLDLLHPDLYQGPRDEAAAARRLMTLYETMGCEPTWTCAPYQLEVRPHFGQHVAWAESNAIVFANSVLGARTHRYGDFIDICAAITGRAPAAGLHLDENRRGQVLFRLVGLRDELLDHDVLAPVLGYLIGEATGDLVPVIEGLRPETPEHRLKALGSAAASSGAVGIFHAVGVTPEASTLAEAMGRREPLRTVEVGPADLRRARDELTSTRTASASLGAVSLGTPHYSVTEFGRLVDLLDGRSIDPDVKFFVNTGRDVWHEVRLRGWADRLEAAGVRVVTDTCTYITPVMGDIHGFALTDSAKWAHYAPGNLGIEVAFGSVDDCVESAVAGRLVRHDELWGG